MASHETWIILRALSQRFFGYRGRSFPLVFKISPHLSKERQVFYNFFIILNIVHNVWSREWIEKKFYFLLNKSIAIPVSYNNNNKKNVVFLFSIKLLYSCSHHPICIIEIKIWIYDTVLWILPLMALVKGNLR